jgi:hypothetical protein
MLGALPVPERVLRRIREPGVNPGLPTQRYVRTKFARTHWSSSDSGSGEK